MLLGTKDGSPSITAQLDLPKLRRQGQEAFVATAAAQQLNLPKLCWRQGQEAFAATATA